MAEVEYPPETEAHRCDLPGDLSDRRDGTLTRCWECGTWWFWGMLPAYATDNGLPQPGWKRVRWYHLRLRARISHLCKEGLA